METAYSLKRPRGRACCSRASRINTNGAEDPFPIEQMQIGQYNGSVLGAAGRHRQLRGQDHRVRQLTGRHEIR